MEIIYLDTNIYMDHFDGRVDKLRPLGQFAFEIVRRTLNCEFKIVMSSLIIDELVFNNYKEKITDLIKDLKEKDKIIKIVVMKNTKKKQERYQGQGKLILTTPCTQSLQTD